MSRVLVQLLGLAGLLGCGLSLLGLAVLVWQRVTALPANGLATANGALCVLDAFKLAGEPFLLSALVFVASEIALRPSGPRPHDRPTDPNDPHA